MRRIAFMEWVADDEIGVRKSAFRRCFHIQGKWMVYGTWFSLPAKEDCFRIRFPCFCHCPRRSNSVVSPCREPHVSPLPGIQERTDSSAYRDFPGVIDGEGEGYPDVFVDRLGDRILVSTRDCAVPVNLGKELAELDVPVFHKRLEQNQKEAPVQIAGPILPLQFEAEEQGVLFRLDMSAGYSQGIFLDQRDHRRRVRERSRPGMKVLNTFAYTGAFSVYAALGGAQTTTLDLASRAWNGPGKISG